MFFGGYFPEGETAKNCESTSRIIPNGNVVKNSAKVRTLGVDIWGYLTAAETCLLFGQCWAGFIQFWRHVLAGAECGHRAA